MLGPSLSGVALFFSITGICVLFVIIWVYKSEIRINDCKKEIKRLKEKRKSLERDKFMLLERLETFENEPGTTREEALKGEKKKLEGELKEARTSLEEILKAVSEKEINKN